MSPFLLTPQLLSCERHFDGISLHTFYSEWWTHRSHVWIQRLISCPWLLVNGACLHHCVCACVCVCVLVCVCVCLQTEIKRKHNNALLSLLMDNIGLSSMTSSNVTSVRFSISCFSFKTTRWTQGQQRVENNIIKGELLLKPLTGFSEVMFLSPLTITVLIKCCVFPWM